MAPSRHFVGIDLGSSHSVIAVYREGRVDVIPNDIGKPTTPSVVAILPSERLVGEAAVAQAVLNPQSTIRNVKGILGRSLKSIKADPPPSVGRALELVGCGERPAFSFKGLSKVDSLVHPEEVAALLLISLKTSAEQFLETTITEAAVAVPAYFTAAQRKAVQQSCRIAGFHKVSLVNDTSAAALTYAVDKEGKRLVVVIDIGGGGGSISIVETSLRGYVRVLATSSRRIPGGSDLDALVLDCLIKGIQVDSQEKVLNDRAYEILQSNWEKLKPKLSRIPQAALKVYLPGIDQEFENVVKREDLEPILKPMLESIECALLEVLEASNIPKNHVNEVVLVGGSTRILQLRSFVKSFFGEIDMCKAVNADEGVACGAALYAASLSGDERVEAVLEDVIPLALRARWPGNVKRLLPPNARVPSRAPLEVMDRKLTIEIEQGLGDIWNQVCLIQNKGRWFGSKENLVCHLSAHGLISWTPLNESTSTRHSFLEHIEVFFPTCLDENQVLALKRRVESYLHMVEEHNRRVEIKNRLEEVCRDLQARLNERSDEEKEFREFALPLIEPTLWWVSSGSGQNAPVEEYKERIEGVVEVLTGYEALPPTSQWQSIMRDLKLLISDMKRESALEKSDRPDNKRLRGAGLTSEVVQRDTEPPSKQTKPKTPASTGMELQKNRSGAELQASSHVSRTATEQPTASRSLAQRVPPGMELQKNRPGAELQASSHVSRTATEQPTAARSLAQDRSGKTDRTARPVTRSSGRATSSDVDPPAGDAAPAATSTPAADAARQRALLRKALKEVYDCLFTKKKVKVEGLDSYLSAMIVERHPEPPLAERVVARKADALRVLAGQALRAVTEEVRAAGLCCLLLDTRGACVSVALRYCLGAEPVERLVALVPAANVTAESLHGRLVQLGLDGGSILVGISMDAGRDTYKTFERLHELLELTLRRQILRVWNTSHSLGDFIALACEEFPPGKEFFITIDCLRELFRDARNIAVLARHCRVDPQQISFATYEETISVVYEQYRPLQNALRSLQDSYSGSALIAKSLSESISGCSFLSVLVTLNQLFQTAKIPSKTARCRGFGEAVSSIQSEIISISKKLCNVYRFFFTIASKTPDLKHFCHCFWSDEWKTQISQVLKIFIECAETHFLPSKDIFLDSDLLLEKARPRGADAAGSFMSLTGERRPLLSWLPPEKRCDQATIWSEFELARRSLEPHEGYSHPALDAGVRALLSLPLTPCATYLPQGVCPESEASMILLNAPIFSVLQLHPPIDIDEAVEEFLKVTGCLVVA